MAKSPYASGRAGSAAFTVEVLGLTEALKRWAAADPMFNKEIRKASTILIRELVVKVQSQAKNAPNPRQASEAAKGFQPRPDRIPVIVLRASTGFVSQSRPNRTRKHKVTRGDVFYGSEFGSDTLRQFPMRSPRFGGGSRGWWFWRTIEDNAETISKRYFDALDEITNKLSRM